MSYILCYVYVAASGECYLVFYYSIVMEPKLWSAHGFNFFFKNQNYETILDFFPAEKLK